MKRMSVSNRKLWVISHYNKLFLDLTCRVGGWNRDKLLNELEKMLKRKRIRER